MQLSEIELVIDGNHDFHLRKDLWIEVQTIIDGDQHVKEISMASIVAKVSRDHYMMKMHKKYPKYGFDKHKWYGTKLHYKMIEEWGVSIIHRKLFLKELFPEHAIRKVTKHSHQEDSSLK